MAQITALHLHGGPGQPFSFSAKASAVITLPLGELGAQFLLGDRYTMLPFTGQVTYSVSTNNTGGFLAGVTVNDVEYPRPLNKKTREFSPGAVPIQNRTFFMWEEQLVLQSVTPKPGDKFLDQNSVTWTIQTADQELANQRWRLVCLKQQ